MESNNDNNISISLNELLSIPMDESSSESINIDVTDPINASAIWNCVSQS